MRGEILFLAHRVPYPPNRGDKIRSWNILKALAKIAPVHLAALCDDPADMAYADHLATVAKSVHLIPHKPSKAAAMLQALLQGGSASVAACRTPSMVGCVESLLRKKPISAVYAFSGQMGQFVVNRTDAPRFIMDFVDMDSAKFETYGDQATGIARFANRFEARRLFAFEQMVANQAVLSLFVSEAEAGLFQSRTGLGSSRVRALENGIDLDHFRPDHPSKAKVAGEGPLLVFTGQMDYAPNIDAVRWFVGEILPLLPDARFAIVGRAPTSAVELLASDKVTVTGEVPDTRDWIAAADVVVAPLLLARGIQNKVLEAMAMGKVVVASSHAAEGIDAVADRHFIVADSPQEQAEAICSLLKNPAKAEEIGSAARAQMEGRYSWDAQLSGLSEILGLAQ